MAFQASTYAFTYATIYISYKISGFFLNFCILEIALKFLKYYTRKSFIESDQTWPCAFYLLRSIWNYSDVNSDIALVG
jgi:hypothetical protein